MASFATFTKFSAESISLFKSVVYLLECLLLEIIEARTDYFSFEEVTKWRVNYL